MQCPPSSTGCRTYVREPEPTPHLTFAPTDILLVHNRHDNPSSFYQPHLVSPNCSSLHTSVPTLLTLTLFRRTHIIFAVLNFALIPTVYFLFPEPKGRSLEEMDVIFASAWADGVSPVKRAKTMPKLTGTQVETELAKYFGEEEAQIRRRSSAVPPPTGA